MQRFCNLIISVWLFCLNQLDKLPVQEYFLNLIGQLITNHIGWNQLNNAVLNPASNEGTNFKYNQEDNLVANAKITSCGFEGLIQCMPVV